jgi:predicted nucleotidyltransferase
MVPEDRQGLNELVALAADVQEFCEGQGWRFCFIGGLVVQRWSEPRFTRDVDLTLLTGFGSEEEFVDALLSRYEGRREDARTFALENRVLLLRGPSGIGIDVALGALAFEESAVDRAVEVEAYPGIRLRFCTVEDLIVMKAFADREEDWRDVRFAIVRQGSDQIDWDYVLRYLRPLVAAKETPEILVKLEKLRAKPE